MNRRYRTRAMIDRGLDEIDSFVDEAISSLLSELSSSRTTLRRGSRGSAVVELQQALNKSGYSLASDGIFGTATDTAVRSFQRARGLNPDGIVGPQTWGALLGGSGTPYIPQPISQTAFIWPVEGRLTSLFGPRINPVTKEFQSLHNGIDIAAPEGTPVKATADGIAYPTFSDPTSGNFVYIKHNGNSSSYSHLSAINIQKGQRVLQGDVIGWVGTTGRSTGPHLHFRVNNAQGVAIDPLPLLPMRSSNFEAFIDELENEFFDAYESFDSDADKLVTRRLPGWGRDGRLPVVDQIPEDFRNIAFGEISRANPGGERRGLADLQQGVLNPTVRNISTTAGGYPVLVTYDNAGRLFVRVFDENTRNVLWAGQLSERVQGPVTEQKVQKILRRALGGMRFTPHRERDRGADLIPRGRAIRLPRWARRQAPGTRRTSGARPRRSRIVPQQARRFRSGVRRPTRFVDSFEDYLDELGL